MSDVDMVIAGAKAADAELERQHQADPGLDIPAEGIDYEAIARAVLAAAGLSTSLDQPTPTAGHASESVHDHLVEWIETSTMLNGQRPVIPRLVELIRERRDFGLRKYGTVLHAHNTRDTLADLVTELIDALAYSQVGIEESKAQRDRENYELRRLRLMRMICEALPLMEA